MSTANGFGIRSNVEGREIRRQHGERRRDDEVVMAASRLNPEPAACARLEHEAFKLVPQQLAARRMVRDRQFSAPICAALPSPRPL